jgi:hypothetical protein
MDNQASSFYCRCNQAKSFFFFFLSSNGGLVVNAKHQKRKIKVYLKAELEGRNLQVPNICSYFARRKYIDVQIIKSSV